MKRDEHIEFARRHDSTESRFPQHGIEIVRFSRKRREQKGVEAKGSFNKYSCCVSSDHRHTLVDRGPRNATTNGIISGNATSIGVAFARSPDWFFLFQHRLSSLVITGFAC